MSIQTIILSVLGTILTALATWAVSQLTNWLSTKIKDNTALKLLNNAISVVQSVVKSVYQTYVESLKDQNMFTAEAQKEALEKAINQATATLSTEVKNYIEENFGDLTSWITLQIESTLYDLKNTTEE